MFKNYIKIAWRSIKKQSFFTALNVFGLVMGIAGCLLISLFIYDELNFDTMFVDCERIHRINVDMKFGGRERISAEVSAPMAAAMKTDFPQVETTTRFRNVGSTLLRKTDAVQNVKETNTTFVDASFFDMFGFTLEQGTIVTALNEPNTLVLTRTAAKKHFGEEKAIGQTLLLNNTDIYTVTGIIEDMPKNSFLRNYSVFLAMAGNKESKEGFWTSHNFPTFIKLAPDANINNFRSSLKSMTRTYVIPFAQRYFPGITEEQFIASGNHLNYSTIALTDIHLYSSMDSEMSSNSSMQNVYILSFIGLFLIVLAIVNFINLSTAQSFSRAKEVGVRKTLGSSRGDLIGQFLIESSLISFIAMVFAIVVSILMLPFFNNLAERSISIPFTNIVFWLLLIITTILLSLFSGFYPAFFMSRFIPTKVLTGSGEHAVGGTKIRNSLVVFQFAISVLLLIGTAVIYQQLDFIQSKDVGFSKDQVLLIKDVYALEDKATSFKEEIQKIAQVKSASLTSYLPTPSSRNSNSFFFEGGNEQENAISMQDWTVDHQYLKTLNIDLIAGRDFNRKYATDSTAIILNQSAVAILGINPDEAIGLRLSRDLGSDDPSFYKVIGVVKNFHFESLRKNIDALSLSLGNSTGSMAVKLQAGDFSSALKEIEKVWEKIAPGQPYNYRFMDDAFNSTYKSEKKLGSIFMTFTILSILIACLGLFGLSAFNAKKRTKEIGVRKVLGAGIRQIAYALTIDFLKLVSISILVALPIGWFVMNKWLEDFSYRIEINWWVLILVALLVLMISILTVSYQSIKAATANPVKSLRTE